MNLSDKVMSDALNAFYEKFGDHIKADGPCMVQAIIGNIPNCKWSLEVVTQVENFLYNQVAAGKLILLKGKTGGFMKPNEVSATITTPAINDHICPCCGNNKVSKTENTCWKCGGSLHP